MKRLNIVTIAFGISLIFLQQNHDIVNLAGYMKIKKKSGKQYLIFNRINLSANISNDSFFIKRRLVYVDPIDSVVHHHLAYNKYFLISVYGKAERYTSGGPEYWNKQIIYLINVKEPETIYKANFHGKFNSLDIREINHKNKTIAIESVEDGKLIYVSMQANTNIFYKSNILSDW